MDSKNKTSYGVTDSFGLSTRVVIGTNDNSVLDGVFIGKGKKLDRILLSKKDTKILVDCADNPIPVFVLTAKDAFSLEMLQKYRELCREHHLPVDFIDSVIQRVEEFEKWRNSNAGNVKIPD